MEDLIYVYFVPPLPEMPHTSGRCLPASAMADIDAHRRKSAVHRAAAICMHRPVRHAPRHPPTVPNECSAWSSSITGSFGECTASPKVFQTRRFRIQSYTLYIKHRFLVIAIVMAILCACSLWRKRRQLCGWGNARPHSQSGDSAGSCYAPPQYSRCSSFHHAPPPYTEVIFRGHLAGIVKLFSVTKQIKYIFV